jgi:membrane protein
MQLEIKDRDILKALNLIGIKNRKIRHIIAFIEMFLERIAVHHLFLISAGIAFNILLYLIPLLLVVVFIISSFFNVNEIILVISRSLNEVLPPGEQSRQLLATTVKEVTQIFSESPTAGIIGICSLLWLSSILLGSIRTGLNTIFHIATPKIFFVYKVKDIFLTIILTVMVFITIYFLPIIAIINSSLHSFVPVWLAPYFSKIYFLVASLTTSFLLFYLLFRFVPNKRLPGFVRILSTGLCVIFIEISRHVFAWYISGVSSYGKFYGTYAILAVMAVWLYYMTMIILLSAEFSLMVYEVKKRVLK